MQWQKRRRNDTGLKELWQHNPLGRPRRKGTRTRLQPEQFIDGTHSYETITDIIGRVVLSPRPPLIWFIIVAMAFVFVNVLLMSITWLILRGIGIWGNNIPVAWSWDIINFVWWIGIGHAGTLISAILLLMRQQWRNSINRFAEAMTIFAVMCAGLYPLLHVGRQWVAYWLFPYPNILGMWPQFRSPLMWDVFAVSTYFSASHFSIGLWDSCRTWPPCATVPQRRYREVRIRNRIAGLARFGTALGTLRDRQPDFRGPFNSTRFVRALHRFVRLCDRHRSRLAHHHLSALLRCGCGLRGLRDGYPVRNSFPQTLRPA